MFWCCFRRWGYEINNLVLIFFFFVIRIVNLRNFDVRFPQFELHLSLGKMWHFLCFNWLLPLSLALSEHWFLFLNDLQWFFLNKRNFNFSFISVAEIRHEHLVACVITAVAACIVFTMCYEFVLQIEAVFFIFIISRTDIWFSCISWLIEFKTATKPALIYCSWTILFIFVDAVSMFNNNCSTF